MKVTVLSKDDRERVKMLNRILGTQYRSTPIDLNNTDNVIEHIAMITAEFMDFLKYWVILGNLAETLDESIEVFYPQEWAKMTEPNGMDDRLLNRAVCGVDEAVTAVSKLVDRSEKKLLDAWNYILVKAPAEIRIALLGEDLTASKRELTEFVSNILDYEIFWEYNGVVEKSLEIFVKGLKIALKENEEELSAHPEI